MKYEVENGNSKREIIYCADSAKQVADFIVQYLMENETPYSVERDTLYVMTGGPDGRKQILWIDLERLAYINLLYKSPWQSLAAAVAELI